ncbi:hypothetical protein HXX76_012708 [Chlamydomonas incerta]|uniref:dihydropyrimidinase n=1 Tax=Chlamydomonas incerta TaxID=51695 RepID=A0A835SGR3_CHLIN|nr:hypothetical protein HXX76_012708 [Chlamydomonas incerta]|eukprot:KAG2426922.1 hypothetical protein HXX76_012708 [Chlamydomonas incerta]
MARAQALSFSALLLCAALCIHTVTASNEAGIILIQGGTVVNHDQQFEGDVLLRGGLIAEVAPRITPPPGARLLNASGCYVLPGGIDPHTHLDMPFMGTVTADDFYTGQAAALAGGTTYHIDFALPLLHDLLQGYRVWKERAARGCMDYSFHMAVTKWTHDVATDMATLVAEGINSFKFFMAYKGSLQVNDEELIEGLNRCKELGALPMVHAENGDMVAWMQEKLLAAGVTGPEGHPLSRPPALEGEATGRAIRLAGVVGVPLYVVHVMSIDAMEEVARARQRGQRVIGEPVASGLALDEVPVWDANFTRAAAFVMSPPLRSAEHAPALRKALASGLLQLVATDHAVFNSSQKAAGRRDFRRIPNGVNGIQERMHVVWQEMVVSGLATPSEYVRMTSTAAAQIFNIYPRKGRLAAGSDADVIILDPRVKHTLGVGASHSPRMDTNVYEGKEIQGRVVTTISRGRLVWHEGVLDVAEGSGRYVPLPAFGPLFEGMAEQARRAMQLPYGPTPVVRDSEEAGSDEGGSKSCSAAGVL